MADAQAVRDVLQALGNAQVANDAARVAAGIRTVERQEMTDEEAQIKVQVTRLEKLNGDDKAKLRRFIKDINTIHTVTPAVAVRVACRLATGNLADAIEDHMVADGGARNAVLWPALRAAVQAALLGANDDRVLRRELQATKQTAHETVAAYGERFLTLARDAHPEPWDNITNETLTTSFARGLTSRRLMRELVIVRDAGTLRETVNRARTIASSETAMGVGDEDAVAAVAAADTPRLEEATDAKPDAHAPWAELTKQVAALSTGLGELRKGVNKPSAPGVKCFNCDKAGHIARECRAPRKPRIEGGGQRRETRSCYNCDKPGHLARDCRGPRRAPTGRGQGQRPPREKTYTEAQWRDWQGGQHQQRPAGQVGAVSQDQRQGNYGQGTGQY